MTMPMAFCSCGGAFRPMQNGVVTLVHDQSGNPYQKIAGDLYTCSRCHRNVLLGLGREGIARHDPRFESIHHTFMAYL